LCRDGGPASIHRDQLHRDPLYGRTLFDEFKSIGLKDYWGGPNLSCSDLIQQRNTAKGKKTNLLALQFFDEPLAFCFKHCPYDPCTSPSGSYSELTL
jgi:hypothetical protein